jgi:hypothetical protein
MENLFSIIRDYLQLDLTNALSTLTPIILALFVSYAIGMLIFYVYKRAFQGVVFNRSFPVTLAIMTILTTMITLAISSNIALSLGMVGALSIVRYRAAIKDPMDILFLFWAVGSGIAVGAKLHYLAFAGALIVILMLLTLNRRNLSSEMFILIVHYTGDDIGDELQRILHGRRYQIKSRTVRKNDVELAVELNVKNNNTAFMDRIREMTSVNDVALIQFTGEYHN